MSNYINTLRMIEEDSLEGYVYGYFSGTKLSYELTYNDWLDLQFCLHSELEFALFDLELIKHPSLQVNVNYLNEVLQRVNEEISKKEDVINYLEKQEMKRYNTRKTNWKKVILYLVGGFIAGIILQAIIYKIITSI